ncbi:MAG: hypothetical protein ACKVW3_17740 [Phycisphaerales bacterium]
MHRFLALAVSLTLAAAALGQRPGLPPQQPERPAGPVVSLRFPGGTVAEYVTALRVASTSEPINITCSTEALSIRIPEVTLKDVSLESALRAAAFAAQENGQQRLYVEPFGGLNRTDAFALALMPVRGRDAADDLQVFSIRDLTESGGVKIETVLTAVETALALTDTAPSPATTKYHKDSGLLMIRGNMSQLNAADQVLKRLESSTKGADARARAARVAQAEAKARLDRSLAMIEVSKRRVEIAQASRDEAAKLGEKGHVSSIDVRNAEYTLAEAIAQSRAAEAEFAAARVAAEEGVVLPDSDSLQDENHRLRDQINALRQRLEQLEAAAPAKSKTAR